MTIHRVVGLLLLFLVIVCGSNALGRTWTDSSGTHTIEGDFVKLTDGKVDIRRNDGKLVRIPLEKLGETDQEQARQFAKAAEVPAAPAPNTPKKSRPVSTAATSGSDAVRPEKSKPAKESKTADTKVIVKGTGLSDDKALKSAFDEAVRQAIGVFVDAETRVRQNDLIEEKILTYSGGFITSHEIVKKAVKDGIHEVTIAAVVKRGSLIERLRENNVTVVGFDGEELLEGDKRPEVLVERALEGWPEGLLTATAPDWTILKKGDDVTKVQVLVKVNVDLEKYGRAAQRLSDVLDQVASKKAEQKWRLNGPRYNVPGGIEIPVKHIEPTATRGWQFNGHDLGILPSSNTDAEHMVILLRPTRTSIEMLQGKRYRLDSNTWSRFVGLFRRKATVLIELLDGDGQIVSTGKIGYDSTCSFHPAGILLQTACGLRYDQYSGWQLHQPETNFTEKNAEDWDKRRPVLISPLLNCYQTSYGSDGNNWDPFPGPGLLSVVTFKVPIDVPTSELPAVKKVRCSVESAEETPTEK